MSEEPMQFDLTPIEIPVIIGDKEYTLREASGEAAGKYQDAILDCMKPGLDGKPTQITGGMSAIEPLLVSMCLFDSEGKPVSKEVIKSWPARVQKEMYKRVRKISDLDETTEDEETAKND